MTNYLYAIHDRGGEHLITDKPGYVIITEAIGHDPNDRSGKSYSDLTNKGLKVMVRLNNAYSPDGTIPTPEKYQDFATRCANFVAASSGIDIVIIGNEPNHIQERPNGQLITPYMYADCFNKCFHSIKWAMPGCDVATAAVAPYDNSTTYSGNSKGDWVIYFHDMLVGIMDTDGICLHAYTHGASPALISSEDMMDDYFSMYHYNFRTYLDFLQVVPAVFDTLPVYITEADQIEPWTDANTGWVQAAYAEIDNHNHQAGSQQIHCLALYRWSGDKWAFQDLGGVHADLRAAVAKGYLSPVGPPVPPAGTIPPIHAPSLPPSGATIVAARDIDPDLITRGVTFEFAHPPAGTGYWRVVGAHWLDEQEADDVGPDHHILGDIVKDGMLLAGVPFLVSWPQDEQNSTGVVSKSADPNASFNYDYAMSSSLNEFNIWVADGNPSDKVKGIGMGAYGNPSIHTSTWIDWEWVIAEKVPLPVPIPPFPIPPLPGGALWHPLPGSIISQHFYQNPDDYSQYAGSIGHNGVDLAGKPQGSSVLAVTDGVVAYTGFDDEGYGNYIRLANDQLSAYSFYAHLSEIDVQVGQVVKGGDTLGSVGSTGNSTGVHLHFEIRMMNVDGSYMADTPMSKGRVDPQTLCILHGLKL